MRTYQGPDIEGDVQITLYRIGNNYSTAMENNLINWGFELYRHNIEYVIKKDSWDYIVKTADMSRKYLQRKGFMIRKFTTSDYERVFNLWRDRIGNYSVKRHTSSRIHDMEKKDECVMLVDENDSLIAACVYEINGKISFGENIAVVDNSVAFGCGGAVFAIKLEKVFSDGICKHILWIWDKNADSINMTKHYGKATGRTNNQFIRLNKFEEGII